MFSGPTTFPQLHLLAGKVLLQISRRSKPLSFIREWFGSRARVY